jgi:hypothetical protein
MKVVLAIFLVKTTNIDDIHSYSYRSELSDEHYVEKNLSMCVLPLQIVFSEPD